MSQSSPEIAAPRGVVARFLDAVERVGNRLPDPALLFLLLMLYNGFQVRAVSPVELLRGGQVGEKEPRARWILAVLGLLFTGAGYWIAQVVSNPMAAIALFFVAVVLVILGTYLLFLSGSIALLRTLRRNRRY